MSQRRALLPAVLHLVTSDAVLSAPDFAERARAVLEAHGPRLALHVRGHGRSGATLFHLARALIATGAGTVLVNDRIDVALSVGAHGVQLGRRSLPVRTARDLVGDAPIGYSAHAAREAADARRDGADFVVLGPVYETTSHPGRPGAGTALIVDARGVAGEPVVAIGGITPDRVAEVLAAGAAGVAVLSGVWAERDPVAAVSRYLEALAAAEETHGA